MLAVVAGKLLLRFEDVILRVVVVDQDEVQLAPRALVVKGLRVAQLGEEVSVASDVGVESTEIA